MPTSKTSAKIIEGGEKMLYIFLIIADLLFALQFLFNQQFRKRNGEGLDQTFTFSMYTNGISFLILLILNGFKFSINLTSFVIALIYSLVILCYSYSGLKSFATANLSVYSIFTMLGGMLMPFAYGVIFDGEDFSAAKAICVLLIGIATALSFEKGKGKGKNLKYYFAVFVLNGLVGVLSAIHQSRNGETVDSGSFMATVNICTFVICLLYHLIKNKKVPLLPLKEVGNLSCYAACSGIGNLLCLIALTSLDASVQYPIITGGVMVFSTLISIVRKEKPSAKTLVSTAIACVSTILMMF